MTLLYLHGVGGKGKQMGLKIGSQVAERLGNRASNQKVAGSIPAVQNDVVSLGKALHPTWLGGMSLYLL